MRGHESGEQPHRRAGVDGVERTGWGAESARTEAVNRDDGSGTVDAGAVAEAADACAERFEAGERGGAVGAGRVAVQPRRAVGDGREHGVAMGDRLVAGDAEASADARDTWNEGRTGQRGHRATILYYPSPPMTVRGGLVRLQIPSLFDMVDLVQVLSDRMGQMAAFDEDAIHWVGVAVRESVINAIKHGNREHPGKRVTIEFAFTPLDTPTELVVRVRDEGDGFDPDQVADPLQPENILKSSGRGIFFMRSFMADVQLNRAPEGGMEVRMVKKLAAGD